MMNSSTEFVTLSAPSPFALRLIFTPSAEIGIRLTYTHANCLCLSRRRFQHPRAKDGAEGEEAGHKTQHRAAYE